MEKYSSLFSVLLNNISVTTIGYIHSDTNDELQRLHLTVMDNIIRFIKFIDANMKSISVSDKSFI